MTATATLEQAPAGVLSQRRIWLFWLPLAASWLLMGTEMPFVNAMLARLGEAERMIAAFGIVGSLSITIESPVIMLLATSTALARSRQNYLMLRRFTQHLMIATTLIHLLVAWTPLFEIIVRGWLNVPEALVEPVRLGMRLMVPWSAAIAWRRFKQGIMIRFGQTRYVGQGTILRLTVSAGLALLLTITSHLPGIAIGTLALASGVIVEATYAHLAVRHLIAARFGPTVPQPAQPPLHYRALVAFHTPLAASTLLYLLTQPLASAALARLPNPELMLAAWPVASGLLFIMRSPALALPEVIIALLDEPGSSAALRKFMIWVGVVCSGLLVLLGFTPLGRFYFSVLIGVNGTLAELAAVGVQIAVVLPLVAAWQSWYRGNLTAARATPALTLAMVINLATMVVILVIGVAMQASGVLLAATALTVATAAETVTLGIAFELHARRQAVVAAPVAAAD